MSRSGDPCEHKEDALRWNFTAFDGTAVLNGGCRSTWNKADAPEKSVDDMMAVAFVTLTKREAPTRKNKSGRLK